MFAQSVIDDVRSRSDLKEIVEQYVPLRKQGARWVARCPFHDEKSPSFSVSSESQLAHCFGCKWGGDVIRFVQEIEGLTFPEALRQLAERAGVDLPETRDPAVVAEDRRRRDVTTRLLAVMESAATFFERQLHEHEDGGIARDELERRGVLPETAARFRLGYAPASWNALVQHLSERGHSPQDAVLAGVLIPSRRGEVDRFRHRVMFPVTDRTGAVIAFSGRILRPTEFMGEDVVPLDAAKYLNSPESPVFTKGEHLFGLHPARDAIRRLGEAVLVEGNFDVVTMHQFGFANTVAPLGTAFTEQQGKLLRRFADAVTLAFDGDKAGREARRKAQPVCAKVGLLARVATLPTDSDPDSYLREPGLGRGHEGMRVLLDGAIGIVEWIIKDLCADSGHSDAERLLTLRQIAPFLASIQDRNASMLAAERVSRALLLPEEMVRDVVYEQRATMPRDDRGSARAGRPTAPGLNTFTAEDDTSQNGERRATAVGIEAILYDRSLLHGPDVEEFAGFLEAPLVTIVRMAIDQWRAHERLDGPALLDTARESGNAGLAPWLNERLMPQEDAVIERCPAALREAIVRLRRCRAARAAGEARRASARAGADGDALAEVRILEEERKRRRALA